MSDLVDDFSEPFAKLAEKVVPAFAEFANDLLTAINDAFLPLKARMRPWETGRELAEVVVENRLTAAERHPVRVTTDYGAGAISVQYDDGSGYAEFVRYRKEAIVDE